METRLEDTAELSAVRCTANGVYALHAWMSSFVTSGRFVAVAELSSFTAAAQELGVSQPALTRTIQQFERCVAALSSSGHHGWFG